MTFPLSDHPATQAGHWPEFASPDFHAEFSRAHRNQEFKNPYIRLCQLEASCSEGRTFPLILKKVGRKKNRTWLGDAFNKPRYSPAESNFTPVSGRHCSNAHVKFHRCIKGHERTNTRISDRTFHDWHVEDIICGKFLKDFLVCLRSYPYNRRPRLLDLLVRTYVAFAKQESFVAPHPSQSGSG